MGKRNTHEVVCGLCVCGCDGGVSVSFVHQWIASVTVKSCAACGEGVLVFLLVGVCMTSTGIEGKKKRSCWVLRLLVVCLGLRFHVFVSTAQAVCISIREQRRRSCGEVKLIEEQKKTKTHRAESCMVSFVLVLVVSVSVVYPT